jgi:iron complex outermembrane receptor protein
MQGSNMQNARMDGMGIVVTGANSMESLQQIEALNGLGAALYGPANPSGMLNFVPKRPTDRPVRHLTFGYDSQTVATVHADVGGRAGSNQMFGYRANLLFGNGSAFVNNSELTRRLASLAGDVRPFANTVVEAFYSYYNVEQRGFPGWFTYGRASAATPFIRLPEDAPDPAREGYGQESAGLDLRTRIGELRVKHDFSANWHLSAGALDQLVTRDISTQVNALTNEAGSYTASLATGFAPQFRVFSNLAYVNGRFNTGSVRHDVAIGSTGYTFKSYSDFTNPSAASVRLGTASISNPVVFALPAAGIPLHDNIFMSSVIHQQGFSLADTATLSGGGRSEPQSARTGSGPTISATGRQDRRLQPAARVPRQPPVARPRMTVYGTYGGSLQRGDIAPGTVANAGGAPGVSEQGEIGYRWRCRTSNDRRVPAQQTVRHHRSGRQRVQDFRRQVNDGIKRADGARSERSSSSTADSRSWIRR